MCKGGAGRKSQDSPHFLGPFWAPGPLISPPPLCASRLAPSLLLFASPSRPGAETRAVADRAWMSCAGRTVPAHAGGSWEKREGQRQEPEGGRRPQVVQIPSRKKEKGGGVRGERGESTVGHQHPPGGKGTRQQSGRWGCKLPSLGEERGGEGNLWGALTVVYEREPHREKAVFLTQALTFGGSPVGQTTGSFPPASGRSPPASGSHPPTPPREVPSGLSARGFPGLLPRQQPPE